MLDVLLDDCANGALRAMRSDAAPTKELLFPNSWQSRAAAAAADTDPQSESIGATTRVALITARIGPGNYSPYDDDLGGRCAVTGCAVPKVLVASHALASAHASNETRLDPYNGCLLIATFDRLFDQGLIGFNDNGTLLCHPSSLHTTYRHSA